MNEVRPTQIRSIARTTSNVSLVVALILWITSSSLAQSTRPAILNDVGIDQKLDAQVPANLLFHDESGNAVHLGDYFGKRPLVLNLVYFRCPMLCTLVLNDLTRTINAMSTSVGKDFDILTVSFDPRETPDLAAAKKRQYLREYGRGPASAEGWHFLTGDEASIRALTKAVGFRYVYDPKIDQYAHASGIMVLTPAGRVSRYFYGVEYSAKDLRLALTEASGGTISGPVEQILLFCFHYDPSTGKYSLAITRLLRVAAALTVVVLATYLFVMIRRERRREKLLPGVAA